MPRTSPRPSPRVRARPRLAIVFGDQLDPDAAVIRSLAPDDTVLMMEVPCCGGLLQIAKLAIDSSQRKVPVKLAVVGIRGDILSEEWTSLN